MPDPHIPAAVNALVRDVVAGLTARQPQLSQDMVEAVSKNFEPLAHLPDSTHALFLGGVHDNVDNVLGWLGEGRPPHHEGLSTGTLAYVRDLARHEVPTTWLRRAYHLATEAFMAELFDEVERLAASGEEKLHVYRHISTWLHEYVDCSTRLATETHDAEMTINAERHHTEVRTQVHRLMKGEAVDADAFAELTGHLLDHHHLGLVLWVEDIGHGPDRTTLLQSVAAEVGAALECEGAPLVLPSGRSEVLVWLGGATCNPWDHSSAIADVVAGSCDVRAAVGSPRAGAEGFRRSMEQARSLRHLAQVAPTVTQRVLSREDDGMAVVAMLAQDVPATRRWVVDTLGPLADDSESARRTRETLRLYLRTASYVETAEQLGLHRNTVKYRITNIVRDRGRDLTSGRLDLELALQVCHVLGDLALRPSATEPD